jgi:hypothetical protein
MIWPKNERNEKILAIKLLLEIWKDRLYWQCMKTNWWKHQAGFKLIVARQAYYISKTSFLLHTLGFQRL